MVHVACTIHSLAGCKQAEQSPHTKVNNPCWPKHTGWLEWRHAEPRRGSIKSNRGTLSRPYLRADTVSSNKRKLRSKSLTDTHSKLPSKSLKLLSVLGTRVLLYRGGFCGWMPLNTNLGAYEVKKRSVAFHMWHWQTWHREKSVWHFVFTFIWWVNKTYFDKPFATCLRYEKLVFI